MNTVKRRTTPEPYVVKRRIGSTIYTANVYFSEITSETLEDKILRLAKNDGLDFQSETAIKSLRTGRSCAHECAERRAV